MSKKPWEDKVSDEELEEVVDADFLDDEDEFEDYEEEEDVTPSDEQSCLAYSLLLLYVFCSLFSILQMSVETKLRNLRNHLDSTHHQLAKLLNLHLARKTQTKMRKVRNLIQKNLQKRNHLQLKHQALLNM